MSYYLWYKLKFVFSPSNNFWGFIFFLLLIPLAVFYGMGAAILVDGDLIELSESTSRAIEMGLLGLIAGTTFLRGFFPSYNPIRSYFKNFHPISPLSRYMLNIIGDLISGYFVIMGIFVAAFFFFSTTVAIEYLGYLVIALIGAHISRRFFQHLFENKIKPDRQFLYLLLACLSLFFLSAGFPFFTEGFTFWPIVSCFCFLILADFVLEELCFKEQEKSKSTARTNRNYTINLLWQNKTVRTTLIVAETFKVLMLSLDLILYYKTGAHFANNVFIPFLFVSPLILFTYLFNNSWGYLRHFWITADQALSTGRDLFWLYLKILWLPLVLDFIISMVFLVLSPSNLVLPGMSMYIASLFILTAGGFFWSSQAPIPVEKAFAFKANTSTFGSIISIGIVSSFLTLFISDWFHLLVPAYIVISLIILKYVLRTYPQKREMIYLELYK